MDMKFDTSKVLGALDGKDLEDAGRIIGGAIVDTVNTSEELFRNSLELNITDFLVERIGKAKPISFHKQLAHRMSMHNKDAAVPEPIELENNLGPDAVTGEINRVPWMAYDVDEMDLYIAELNALLAKKDAAIVELKNKLDDAQAKVYADSIDAWKRERRLKRALYKACTNEEERRWRKCSEEKPPHSGIYLVCIAGHVRTLDTFDSDRNLWRNYNPTHWMPLPSAPKEENK